MTLRCLREDLGLEVPPVEVDIATIDHPLIAEARRVARRRLWVRRECWRLTVHSCTDSGTGATWLEYDEGRLWLCAAAQREERSPDDAYELFATLNESGRLLQDDDDRLRDALESNARIIDAAVAEIPSVLEHAFADRGVTSRFRIGDLVDARLHVPAAGDDVWVALATQAADGRFVEERLCDVLFGVVFDAARAEVVEPRADWPGTQARERNPLRAGTFAPVTAAVSTA